MADGIKDASEVMYFSTSFISQLLLILIYWDLAKTQNFRERWHSVKVGPFDEEAELQARIWAGLVRKENDNFQVVETESIAATLLEISLRS